MFAVLTRNAFGMRVIFIHLMKSRTKSLYLILKKNLKLNKVAILFVRLFVFFFVKTWLCFHTEANIEKNVVDVFLLN